MLAGGLIALAVLMCLAQWLATVSARPGPGLVAVAGHVVAAVAAVGLQLAAERSCGRSGVLASWSVVVLAVTVIWLGWWA